MSKAPKENTGVAAREAVLDYFLERDLDSKTNAMIRAEVDHFLGTLYLNGFIVAPRGYRAPVRRGNPKTPPKYTGPTMLGKSHSAAIIKQ